MKSIRAIWIVSCCLGLLSACHKVADAPVKSAWQTESAKHSVHRVQPGESLYSIAWQYGEDYLQLAQINQLEPPYTLHPGQDIAFEAHRTAKTSPVNAKPRQRLASSSKWQAEAPIGNWRWPTRGRVVKPFIAGKNGEIGHKGIDIAGKARQAIVASAQGEVIYSGDGLPGYGNLIIIKHAGGMMTAYGHNAHNWVKEGATVVQGQQIADMGQAATKETKLHFEMRLNGKPVNPVVRLSPLSGKKAKA